MWRVLRPLLALGPALAMAACGGGHALAPSPLVSPSATPVSIATVAMPAGVLAVDGNSLTQSRNGAVAMPANVMHDLGDPATLRFVNAGESGHTTTQMLTTALTLVDPLYKPGQVNVCLYWEGENDLYFGADAGTAFDHLRAYGQARQRVGFTVVLLTLLPRGDLGVPVTYEADRAAVNALLRANWPTFADALVDVAADPIMGDPAQDAAGVYISQIDHVHLTDAGSLRVAQLVAEVLRPLLRATH